MISFNTSNSPEKSASKTITHILESYKNSDVLLLLAGGSALKVLEHVDTGSISEYTTIMMMDERFSSDPKTNNFLLMSQGTFYSKALSNDANFITSIPADNELHSAFSSRIQSALQEYLAGHTKTTVIALFGIGPDGHTAAIFPMELEPFTDTYGQGDLYVPVTYEKNPHPYRSSITPKFISQYVKESVVYATGEEKIPVFNRLQMPHELHTLPAYIHDQIDSKVFTNLEISA